MRSIILAGIAFAFSHQVLAACVADPATGLCVPPFTVVCTPPLLWRVNRCECPNSGLPVITPNGPACPEAPPRRCLITIEYPEAVPSSPTITLDGCARDGQEVAAAAAILKLLEDSRR